MKLCIRKRNLCKAVEQNYTRIRFPRGRLNVREVRAFMCSLKVSQNSKISYTLPDHSEIDKLDQDQSKTRMP